ncbi:hypothetical protein IKS57_00815 [bacterium]|nr:hypothetical protein [bacterium]
MTPGDIRKQIDVIEDLLIKDEFLTKINKTTAYGCVLIKGYKKLSVI